MIELNFISIINWCVKMGRSLTDLGHITRAFPLRAIRATFLMAFDQYLYSSLVRAETLHYRLYMNLYEPSYPLQKRLASIFQVIATAYFMRSKFLFFFLMTHRAYLPLALTQSLLRLVDFLFLRKGLALTIQHRICWAHSFDNIWALNASFVKSPLDLF